MSADLSGELDRLASRYRSLSAGEREQLGGRTLLGLETLIYRAKEQAELSAVGRPADWGADQIRQVVSLASARLDRLLADEPTANQRLTC